MSSSFEDRHKMGGGRKPGSIETLAGDLKHLLVRYDRLNSRIEILEGLRSKLQRARRLEFVPDLRTTFDGIYRPLQEIQRRLDLGAPMDADSVAGLVAHGTSLAREFATILDEWTYDESDIPKLSDENRE